MPACPSQRAYASSTTSLRSTRVTLVMRPPASLRERVSSNSEIFTSRRVFLRASRTVPVSSSRGSAPGAG